MRRLVGVATLSADTSLVPVERGEGYRRRTTTPGALTPGYIHTLLD